MAAYRLQHVAGTGASRGREEEAKEEVQKRTDAF
jgi:hypothetical protein